MGMTNEYAVVDVDRLAQAIFDHWEDHETSTRYRCRFCTGYQGSDYPTRKVNGYHHSLDCPVLIAQDVSI